MESAPMLDRNPPFCIYQVKQLYLFLWLLMTININLETTTTITTIYIIFLSLLECRFGYQHVYGDVTGEYSDVACLQAVSEGGWHSFHTL